MGWLRNPHFYPLLSSRLPHRLLSHLECPLIVAWRLNGYYWRLVAQPLRLVQMMRAPFQEAKARQSQVRAGKCYAILRLGASVRTGYMCA